MIAEDFRYYRGGRDCYEAVELDEVRSDGMYITTCVVNVDLLVCGITVFPCGNGDDLKLSPELQLKVLEFVQEERRKITEGETVKSLDGWHKSGLRTYEEYCKPGELVTEDIVDEFANSVPPKTFKNGFVQAGEAYSTQPDENGAWRDTYTTFTYHGTDSAGRSLWLHNGYCFAGQTNNMVEVKTRLERRIEELREEVRND